MCRLLSLLAVWVSARLTIADTLCTWQESLNININGGTLASSGTTLPLCWSVCEQTSGCMSVDWDVVGLRCYILYTQNGKQAMMNVNHYDCMPEADSCSSGPCLNGGQCYSSGTSFFCSCPSGFSGTNCQVANPCNSNPCQNGGQCIQSSSPNTFTCNCAVGWTGINCQTPSCRKQDVMKDPNAWRYLRTNYKGDVSSLLSPVGGVSWTFSIPSFTFQWPSGLNGRQITNIQYSSSTNMAFLQIDFVDIYGQPHLTDPVMSNSFSPKGINAGSKVTVYLMPIDYTRNVTIVGLQIFYCNKMPIIGSLFPICLTSSNIFGSSGGLLGDLLSIVTLGIIQLGTDGSVTWSSLLDAPYFEVDLNRLGYGVSEINMVQINQVNNIASGTVKIWVNTSPVTVSDSVGFPTEQFGFDPITPGALIYNFRAGLRGDRIRVILNPGQSSAKSTSLTVWFQSASILIC